MEIHSWKIKKILSILLPNFIQIFASVKLNVEQNEIELGKPLQLSCEVLGGGVTGSRKWLGGKDIRLLCLNGVSSNPNKYQESQINGTKYQLTIEKVTESDLNCPYACRFGFQSGERNLSVNEKNFKYIPSEDPPLVKYTKEDRMFAIGLTFDKVFPVPSCAVVTKSKRKVLTIVDQKRNGIFYTVEFSNQSEEPFHSCGSPVEIECTIKEDKYNISLPHTLECNDAVPTINEEFDNLLITVMISVVCAAVLLLVVISVIIRRRIKRNKSERAKRNEKDMGDGERSRPLMTIENCSVDNQN